MYRPTSFNAQAPGLIATWAAQLVRWLTGENQRIAEEFTREKDFVILTVLHAAPERIYPGQHVCADGSDWNPGSGEGTYRRNSANNAWIFLG